MPPTSPAAAEDARADAAPTLRLLGVPVTVTLRAEHLAQVAAQLGVFLYTALYWPPAAALLPRLAALTLFGFAADFALSARRYGSWRLGVGPVPVVLSANLFVWFTGPYVWLHYAVVLIGLAAKHHAQREGRHVFNPSAIGVAAVGAFALLLPGRLGALDISPWLGATPNALEVTLLLSLVPLSRARVALIPLAAAAATAALLALLPALLPSRADVPVFVAAPIYIGVALLATDPATTPRRPVAQLAFGAAYITLFAILSSLLGADGRFWGKVLPIPLLNLLAPRLDAWAATLPSPRLLDARHDRVHLGLWVAVVVAAALATPVKARLFTEMSPRVRDLRHLRPAAGGEPCAANPAFCRPFSFAAEAALWGR